MTYKTVVRMSVVYQRETFVLFYAFQVFENVRISLLCRWERWIFYDLF